MKLRWRFGIIAGLFLAVFSLYPQMKMIYLRGAEWNGHYAYNDIDEVAYAILFLASDEASYITGQVLAVNGGMYT